MSVLLISAGGCAARTAAYEPVNATGRSGGGLPAAMYSVSIEKTRLASVKVWSGGGYQATIDGKEMPVVELRVRIRNQSDSPITLDTAGSDLELVNNDGAIAVADTPVRVDGDTTVAPGALGRFGLIYALPSGLEPGSVVSLELNWELNTGKGPYTQSTAFRQVGKRGVRWVYEPYWYGPWGYGPYGRDPYWGWPYGYDDEELW